MVKILIAEDDSVMANMLKDVLVDGGYEVCGIARTVDEAVALDEHHRPDLAILDVRLAEGGLGTDVSARLTRNGRPGILYVTVNIDQFGLTRANGEGSLRKPYRPADVVRALKIVEEIVATGEASRPFPEGFRLLGPSSTDDRPPRGRAFTNGSR
jgi:DNA-binding response OmpR family regulator